MPMVAWCGSDHGRRLSGLGSGWQGPWRCFSREWRQVWCSGPRWGRADWPCWSRSASLSCWQPCASRIPNSLAGEQEPLGVDRGAADGAGLATLSVSNSLSGRHWEMDQVPAVGDRTDIVQLGTGHPCVRRRRSTACGPSTTRGCVPRCRRPDVRCHAKWPQSWIQRENWEFETHRSVAPAPQTSTPPSTGPATRR